MYNLVDASGTARAYTVPHGGFAAIQDDIAFRWLSEPTEFRF